MQTIQSHFEQKCWVSEPCSLPLKLWHSEDYPWKMAVFTYDGDIEIYNGDRVVLVFLFIKIH